MGYERRSFFAFFSVFFRLRRGVEERILKEKKKSQEIIKRGNCQKIMIYSRFLDLSSPACSLCDFCVFLEGNKKQRAKKHTKKRSQV